MVASYCELWKDELIAEYYESEELLRPNGAILCYPAILFDDFIYHLMDRERYPTYLERMSLEMHVDADFPRTFVWHTYEDSVAKVDNSIDSIYFSG